VTGGIVERVRSRNGEEEFVTIGIVDRGVSANKCTATLACDYDLVSHFGVGYCFDGE
jgi:hypothetical protein